MGQSSLRPGRRRPLSVELNTRYARLGIDLDDAVAKVEAALERIDEIEEEILTSGLVDDEFPLPQMHVALSLTSLAQLVHEREQLDARPRRERARARLQDAAERAQLREAA